MNIKDKVAIITGASSGIGLATANLFAKNEAKVALVARSKDKINRLSSQLPHSLAIPADMTKESEIKKMVQIVYDYYGRIDILINNAGRGYDAPIDKIHLNKLRELIDLNFIGPLTAMQSIIPIMRKKGGGAIVNISSGTSLMYLPGMSAYSSLKRALNGLSLTAREELKKDHITVSVIYPYITATDFEKNTIKHNLDTAGSEEEFDKDLPPPDSAEYVAGKILEAITTGKAEIYAHDWMKRLH